MELKEGMYVITNDRLHIGKIYNINDFREPSMKYAIYFPNANDFIFIGETDFKASFDIIDLIKVGDYVNGEKVIALREEIDEKNIYFNNKNCNIFTDYSIVENYYFGIEDKDIKSVVTREQFEAISYKVGE